MREEKEFIIKPSAEEPTDRMKTQRREKSKQQHIRKVKKRRKRKYMFYYLLFFILLIAAVLILSLTVFFKIDDIKVTNTGSYSTEEVLKASGVSKGDNLIRCNPSAVQNKILKECLFLDDVVVSRKLPNELDIAATPAVVTYNYQTDAGYVYASQSGKILAIEQPTPYEGAITLTGIIVDTPKVGKNISLEGQLGDISLDSLAEMIQSAGLTDISSVSFGEDQLTVIYQNRVAIEIKDSDDAAYILKFSKTLLDSYIGKNEQGWIFYQQSDKSVHFLPKV